MKKQTLLNGFIVLIFLVATQGQANLVSAAPSTPPRFLTLPFPSNSGVYFYDGWWYDNSHASTPDSPTTATHQGIDYLNSSTTSFPVLAAADGEARWRSSTTYGNVIEIRHIIGQETWYTIYAHLQDVLINNDGNFHPVSRGAHIGNAGKTGVWPAGSPYAGQPYTTIHLHFELSKNAPPKQAGYERVDPYGVYGGGNYYPGNSTAFTTNPPSYSDNTPPPSICPAPGNGLPRDNNPQNSNTITFNWSPPNCSGLDYYTFRISTSSDLNNNWFVSRTVSRDATSTAETIPTQYNSMTLYWGLIPHNGAGNGTLGGPWAFKVDTSLPPQPPTFPKDNWTVEYFSDKEMTSRCDNTDTYYAAFLFLDWGDNAPRPACPADNWGARFTRRINFPGGWYNFSLEADDWARIYVDNTLVVNHWQGYSAHKEGWNISAGEHDVRIEFADTLGAAKIFAWWSGPGYEVPLETRDANQWYAEYWLNPNLEWDVFAQRNEGSGRLDHDDWGNNSPGWNMQPDFFSVRFTRQVFFDCGTYRFVLDHDDGARWWIDNVLIDNKWDSTGADSYNQILTRGTHEIKVEYHEDAGFAHLSLDWQMLSGCTPAAPSLSSPQNNTSLAWDSTITLAWDASNGATQYYASLTGGPGISLNSDWISGTSWQIGNLPPGNYTWSVIARNDYGASAGNASSMFNVLEPPIHALFDATPLSGNAPLIVTFHNNSAGNYTTCSWTYGDGQTGNNCVEYHTHSYTSPGIYAVTLALSGPGGSDSLQRTSYIQVGSSTTCYSLVTSNNPSGGGTIHLNPTPNCGNNYTAGTLVEVSVEANPGYQFNEWFGALVGNASPAYVYMDGSKILTANYTATVTPYWRGEYYPNATLSGTPVYILNSPVLHIDWGYNAPDLSLPADNFSARFTRVVTFRAGNYKFHLSHDDGGRVYVDGQLLVDAWNHCCTWDDGVKSLNSGNHEIRVEINETGGAANVEFWWEKLDIAGWKAEYFNNDTLSERPTIIRDDPQINFSWLGDSPDPMIQSDHFSVRWTRSVYFPKGITHFVLGHDDGARFFIDGNLVFEDWCNNCVRDAYFDHTFNAGYHTLCMEMFDNQGWSGARLTWTNDSHPVYLPLIRR